MDVLDTYKETWKNQSEDAQKVSKGDIYKMTHKKSSSIVKWIFIISIIEFIAMLPFYFIDLPKSNSAVLDKFEKFYNYLGIFLTFFIIYFIYKFYVNYKNISASDDTQTLMKKILKTRKTVRTYVFLNLGIMCVIIFYESWLVYQENFSNTTTSNGLIFIAVAIIISIIILLVTLGIYQLIYGILLKKLNRNYKELAKLEE